MEEARSKGDYKKYSGIRAQLVGNRKGLADLEAAELRARGRKQRKDGYDNLLKLKYATGDFRYGGARTRQPEAPPELVRFEDVRKHYGDRNPLLDDSVVNTGNKKPGDKGYGRRIERVLAKEAQHQADNPEDGDPDTLADIGNLQTKHQRRVLTKTSNAYSKMNKLAKALNKGRVGSKKWLEGYKRYLKLEKQNRDLFAEFEFLVGKRGVRQPNDKGWITKPKKGSLERGYYMLNAAYDSAVQYQNDLVAQGKMPRILEGADPEEVSPVIERAAATVGRMYDTKLGVYRDQTPMERLVEMFASGEALDIIGKSREKGEALAADIETLLEQTRDNPVLSAFYRTLDEEGVTDVRELQGELKANKRDELIDKASQTLFDEYAASPEFEAEMPSVKYPQLFEPASYVVRPVQLSIEEALAQNSNLVPMEALFNVPGVGLVGPLDWLPEYGPPPPWDMAYDAQALNDWKISADLNYRRTVLQGYENQIRKELRIDDPGALADLMRSDLLTGAQSVVATVFLGGTVLKGVHRGDIGVNITDLENSELPVNDGTGRYVRHSISDLDPQNAELTPETGIAMVMNFIGTPFTTILEDTETGETTARFSLPFQEQVPINIEITHTTSEAIRKEIAQELFASAEAVGYAASIGELNLGGNLNTTMKFLTQSGEIFVRGNLAGILNFAVEMALDPTNFFPFLFLTKKGLAGLRASAAGISNPKRAGWLRVADVAKDFRSGFQGYTRMSDTIAGFDETLAALMKRPELDETDRVILLQHGLAGIKLPKDTEGQIELITELLRTRAGFDELGIDPKLLKTWVEENLPVILRERMTILNGHVPEAAALIKTAKKLGGSEDGRQLAKTLREVGEKAQVARKAGKEAQEKLAKVKAREDAFREAARKKAAAVAAARKKKAAEVAAEKPAPKPIEKPAPKPIEKPAPKVRTKRTERSLRVKQDAERIASESLNARRALRRRLAKHKKIKERAAEAKRIKKRKPQTVKQLEDTIKKNLGDIAAREAKLARGHKNLNRQSQYDFIDRAYARIDKAILRGEIEYGKDLSSLMRNPSPTVVYKPKPKPKKATVKRDKVAVSRELRARVREAETRTARGDFEPKTSKETERGFRLEAEMDGRPLGPTGQSSSVGTVARVSDVEYVPSKAATATQPLRLRGEARVGAAQRGLVGKNRPGGKSPLWGDEPTGGTAIEDEARLAQTIRDDIGWQAEPDGSWKTRYDFDSIDFIPGSAVRDAEAAQVLRLALDSSDEAMAHVAFIRLKNLARQEWGEMTSLQPKVMPMFHERQLIGAWDDATFARAAREEEALRNVMLQARKGEKRIEPPRGALDEGDAEVEKIVQELGPSIEPYAVHDSVNDFYKAFQPWDPNHPPLGLDPDSEVADALNKAISPAGRRDIASGDFVEKLRDVAGLADPKAETPFQAFMRSQRKLSSAANDVVAFRVRNQFGYDLFHGLLNDAGRRNTSSLTTLARLHDEVFAAAFDDKTGRLIDDDVLVNWLLMEARAGLPFALAHDVIETVAMKLMVKNGVLPHVGLQMFNPSYAPRVAARHLRVHPSLHQLWKGDSPSWGGTWFGVTDPTWSRAVPEDFWSKTIKRYFNKASDFSANKRLSRDLLAWTHYWTRAIDGTVGSFGRWLGTPVRATLLSHAVKSIKWGNPKRLNDEVLNGLYLQYVAQFDAGARVPSRIDFAKGLKHADPMNALGPELGSAYEMAMRHGVMVPDNPFEATAFFLLDRQFWGGGSYQRSLRYLDEMAGFSQEMGDQALEMVRNLYTPHLHNFRATLKEVGSGPLGYRNIDAHLETDKGKLMLRISGKTKRQMRSEAAAQRDDALGTAAMRQQKELRDKQDLALGFDPETGLPKATRESTFEADIGELSDQYIRLLDDVPKSPGMAKVQLKEIDQLYDDLSAAIMSGTLQADQFEAARKLARELAKSTGLMARHPNLNEVTLRQKLLRDLAGIPHPRSGGLAEPKVPKSRAGVAAPEGGALKRPGVKPRSLEEIEALPRRSSRLKDVEEQLAQVNSELADIGSRMKAARAERADLSSVPESELLGKSAADKEAAHFAFQKKNKVARDRLKAEMDSLSARRRELLPEKEGLELKEADLHPLGPPEPFEALPASAQDAVPLPPESFVDVPLPGPEPSRVAHVQGAVLAGDSGMSQVDWLRALQKRQRKLINSRSTSNAKAKELRASNREISRALLYIRIEKKGGSYRPPQVRWKDAWTSAVSKSDETAGIIPENQMSFYAETRDGMETEMARSVYAMRQRHSVRPGGQPGLRNFRSENWEEITEAVRIGVKEVQPERTSPVGLRTLKDEALDYDEADNLLRTRRDYRPRVVAAKVKSLAAVQKRLGIPESQWLSVEDYDRIRTLLQPHMGKRNRGLAFIEEAKQGDDFRETFLAARRAKADENATNNVAWTMLENPGMSVDDAVAHLKNTWYRDGTLKYDPSKSPKLMLVSLMRGSRIPRGLLWMTPMRWWPRWRRMARSPP
jgi:hypothetical protein